METKQIYKIGDCLELMKEIPDNSIDLILTDPPYGVDIGHKGSIGGGSFRGATQKFNISWDRTRIDKKYFDEMIRVSKNQIIFGGNYYTDYLKPSRCWLMWYKRDGLPRRTFADFEIAWTSFDKNSLCFNWRWDGFIRDGDEDKVRHPTQKPIDLFVFCLKEFSEEGNTVLDPFLGSGTTLRACRETNRNCIGFEINPDYEPIIRKRLMADTPPLDAFL